MTDTITVDLNDQQRELLLQGLRFVRSHVMLEIHEPSPERDEHRLQRMREIDELASQLRGQKSANAPASV